MILLQNEFNRYRLPQSDPLDDLRSERPYFSRARVSVQLTYRPPARSSDGPVHDLSVQCPFFRPFLHPVEQTAVRPYDGPSVCLTDRLSTGTKHGRHGVTEMLKGKEVESRASGTLLNVNCKHHFPDAELLPDHELRQFHWWTLHSQQVTRFVRNSL